MAIIKSAGFETNTDNHVAWYSATVARDTVAARTGTASLSVTCSDAFSGVQLDNYPYFSVIAGAPYDCEVWYIEKTGTMAEVKWNLEWRASDVSIIRTDIVSMPRVTTWTRARVAGLVSPAGAVTLSWTFTTSTAPVNSAYRLDDLLVQDAVVAFDSTRFMSFFS